LHITFTLDGCDTLMLLSQLCFVAFVPSVAGGRSSPLPLRVGPPAT
jgi:hypothetical protein